MKSLNKHWLSLFLTVLLIIPFPGRSQSVPVLTGKPEPFTAQNMNFSSSLLTPPVQTFDTRSLFPSPASADFPDTTLQFFFFTNQTDSDLQTGAKKGLEEQLSSWGIGKGQEIYTFDIRDPYGATELPRNSESELKKWILQHNEAITITYCVVRFSVAGGTAGYGLYRFYDLIHLSTPSIIEGALMGGFLSLVIMKWSVEIDQWMAEKPSLISQFSRFLILSTLYISLVKLAYISREISVSGFHFLTESFLTGEASNLARGLTASTAQMLFGFWNANRKSNKDLEIEMSNHMSKEQKHQELEFQNFVSRTNAFLNSILNNSLAVIISTASSSNLLEAVSYSLVFTGGLLYFKEFRRRRTLESNPLFVSTGAPTAIGAMEPTTPTTSLSQNPETFKDRLDGKKGGTAPPQGSLGRQGGGVLCLKAVKRYQ